jgi:hypothetical protein
MIVAQLVNIQQLDNDSFFAKDKRVVEGAFKGSSKASGRDALGITAHSFDDDVDSRPVGFATPLGMLFCHELTNFRGDTGALILKFGLTIFLGILIGIIFFDVSATTYSTVMISINSHFGALIICLVMGMFGTAQAALLGFPWECPVFLLRVYSRYQPLWRIFLLYVMLDNGGFRDIGSDFVPYNHDIFHE